MDSLKPGMRFWSSPWNEGAVKSLETRLFDAAGLCLRTGREDDILLKQPRVSPMPRGSATCAGSLQTAAAQVPGGCVDAAQRGCEDASCQLRKRRSWGWVRSSEATGEKSSHKPLKSTGCEQWCFFFLSRGDITARNVTAGLNLKFCALSYHVPPTHAPAMADKSAAAPMKRVSRACTFCRARKSRCDRTSPPSGSIPPTLGARVSPQWVPVRLRSG